MFCCLVFPEFCSSFSLDISASNDSIILVILCNLGSKDEAEDEIHCMEDKGSATFFTLAAYEESLLQDQTSQELDRGVVLQTGEQQRYNLR